MPLFSIPSLSFQTRSTAISTYAHSPRGTAYRKNSDRLFCTTTLTESMIPTPGAVSGSGSGSGSGNGSASGVGLGGAVPAVDTAVLLTARHSPTVTTAASGSGSSPRMTSAAEIISKMRNETLL